MKVAYICDGLVPECSDKVGCYRLFKPGMSDCNHTFDPSHAVNGVCDDPQNYPERFNKLDTNNDICYWEGDYDWPKELK